VADRIAATFPTARVLMVIREQARMIVSCYRQYVRIGGTGSLGRYVSPPPGWGDRVPQFNLQQFAYDRLIGHYQELLGRDRLCVLPFELLARDPDAFAAQVAGFAGVEPGPVDPEPSRVGWGGVTLNVKRGLNLFVGRDQVNPGAPLQSRRLNQWIVRTFDA